MILGKSIHWVALCLAIAANIVANMALKSAMTANLPSGSRTFAPAVLLSQPTLWIGLVSAFVLLACYLFAIRTLPISVAYILVTSLAMVGIVICESVMFGLALSLSKIAGMVCVVFGLWLVTRGM